MIWINIRGQMTLNLNCQQYTLCSYCISHHTRPWSPPVRCTGPSTGNGTTFSMCWKNRTRITLLQNTRPSTTKIDDGKRTVEDIIFKIQTFFSSVLRFGSFSLLLFSKLNTKKVYNSDDLSPIVAQTRRVFARRQGERVSVSNLKKTSSHRLVVALVVIETLEPTLSSPKLAVVFVWSTTIEVEFTFGFFELGLLLLFFLFAGRHHQHHLSITNLLQPKFNSWSHPGLWGIIPLNAHIFRSSRPLSSHSCLTEWQMDWLFSRRKL